MDAETLKILLDALPGLRAAGVVRFDICKDGALVEFSTPKDASLTLVDRPVIPVRERQQSETTESEAKESDGPQLDDVDLDTAHLD